MNTVKQGWRQASVRHEDGASPPDRKWSRGINWVSGLLIVVCLIVLVRILPVDRAIQLLQNRVDASGVAGPLIFAAAYVVGSLLFVPGSALTLAAGAVFGLLWGAVIVSLASTTTAAAAFLIARYVARSRVKRAAQGNAKFAAIDEAMGEGSWRIVALLRLSPAIPFSLGNYLFGLTSIRFWPYVLASWVAMLPGTFMYVYIGHIGAQGLQAAGGDTGAVDIGKWVLLGLGLIATVVVTVYVTRLAQRALDDRGFHAMHDDSDSGRPDTTAPDKAGIGLRTVALATAALVAVALTVFASSQREALRGMFGPPQVELQEVYTSNATGARFDHSRFDELLRKHVSDGGLVNYEGLQADSSELDAYIASVANAPFSKLDRNEKLALLINAYNAFTLRLILDHYPLDSITDIPAAKRWEDKRWRIGKNTWTLNQIEHEQIRPMFREPRIHFALVCAAVGCPPLRTEVYTGADIEKQLEDQARYVHKHNRWFRFDADTGVVHLTELYDWYGDDFKQVAGSVLQYAAKYSRELQRALEEHRDVRIQWIQYDWRLNSRENKP